MRYQLFHLINLHHLYSQVNYQLLYEDMENLILQAHVYYHLLIILWHQHILGIWILLILGDNVIFPLILCSPLRKYKQGRLFLFITFTFFLLFVTFFINDFKSPINSTYESFKRRKLYLKINSSFFIFIFEYTRAKLSFKDDFEWYSSLIVSIL